MAAPKVEQVDRGIFPGKEPSPPVLTSPGSLSSDKPPEKDHIFGDVLGTIEGGLKKLFDDSGWEERMGAYDGRLTTCLNEIRHLDLGHKAEDEMLTVGREPNGNECDQQSYRFGCYSEQFKWRLCSCALKDDDVNGQRKIEIKIPAPCWQMYVIDSLNNLMKSLVDECALTYFLAYPRKNRDVLSKPCIHAALALSEVPGRLKRGEPSDMIQAVLPNFNLLTLQFANMLHIIGSSAPRTCHYVTALLKDVWING